jgi:single-stranded-DNA-specific exonuclease
MSKVWKVLPQKSNDLITQLLLNRGIKTEEEKEKFFNPKLEDFQKDLEIPGIKKSQERIKKAVELQELIVVYGDYDVDGIASCAILYKALSSLGAKVLPYIPHREKEGYGLGETGLEFARDSGASLVITVDNGIVALEQAKFAKKLGLDLIITDHHLPLEEKPVAYSIVHSTKMCGAGVAWCLIREMVKESLAEELLEFVCIATITDLIPLTGLARAFVKVGLKQVNKTSNLGLLSLFNECAIGVGEITAYTVGHIIGPRLNAIGRLEHAIDALRLLCTKDPAKARKLAKLLCDTNLRRQDLTIQAIEQARLQIDKNKKIHVLSSKEWIPGIIGLIAGRVAEEHYRPAIAISIGETHSKGSARSVDGINIVEVIRESCGDILVDVGGHKGAAGFSILNEHIEIFQKRIEIKIGEVVLENPEPILEIEAEVEVGKISKTLAKELEKFEPLGFGNPPPLLASKNMKVSDVRTVGSGKHLKFKAEDIDCIAFGMGNLEGLLKTGSLVSLAYFLEINRYNGAEILQLKVRDIIFK